MQGNVSLESLLLRQSKANPISSEEVAKTVWIYIILDTNMNRNNQIQ